MSEAYPPFLKWGQYKSDNGKDPDILEVKVLAIDTFETEYSINIPAKVDNQDVIIPLQSFESKNKQLLQIWHDEIRNGKIKPGKHFKIKTWLGVSRNKHPIRRFELEF